MVTFGNVLSQSYRKFVFDKKINFEIQPIHNLKKSKFHVTLLIHKMSKKSSSRIVIILDI